ncbi:MAG: hypothetical protein QM599_01520 [Pseudoxanthomonas sp.]
MSEANETARAIAREIQSLRPLADYLRLCLLDIPEVHAGGRLPLLSDVLNVASEYQKAADKLRKLASAIDMLAEQADAEALQ